MHISPPFIAWASLGFPGLALAVCPYADPSAFRPRDEAAAASGNFYDQFTVDDKDKFLTNDFGGPIGDQFSLKAGDRGSTLLEDFIFREKITRFDHERVPERAVHARGAGAYGTFTSYGDFSNITSASFLSAAGKKTETFVRFSTVAGSRGSADTVRDIRGFATRLYTDEGNFDIVGNNVPVFFIQDAIRFPDLIHAVKPSPDNEIPQAATAHDSAWDFFSSQPSTLHALLWAMSPHGTPRSFRHMDGFGVHSFRLVNDKGESHLVKFHWKTKQGLASLIWEEAQILSGKNADFHRQDLWDAIQAGNGPEWELSIQLVKEEDALAFGFDLLDPTKILPLEFAPLQPLGVMKLDRNPTNYFAETEQAMFQVGHVVSGIDFSEDPLMQGRIFSYLDTQLNRHNGPNFEQLPVNRPRVSVHSNHRDGAAQMKIHKNIFPYTPSALSNGPKQADQEGGRGFITAPRRTASGGLKRALSETFNDHWTQPRLFFNSLAKEEQQMVVNAIRFELSNIKAEVVRKNVLQQLNLIHNGVASRVAKAVGMEPPAPDPRFYHNNKTAGLSVFGGLPLPSIKGLRVAVLAAAGSVSPATGLKDALKAEGLAVTVIGEFQARDVDATYSASDATVFDGLVVAPGAEAFFSGDGARSTPVPARQARAAGARCLPLGKPVGAFGSAATRSPASACP
ncbi:catalase-3, partial [Magnaporthiopsis poae ATCC 64411]